MLRLTHRRCWVAAAPGGPEGRHHTTEQGAARAFTDRLLAAADQVVRGKRRWEDMPVEELMQLDQPCWTMRCSGCRQQLLAGGQRHWPGPEQARRAATRAGWAGELELCDRCAELVVPLRPRIERRTAGFAVG